MFFVSTWNIADIVIDIKEEETEEICLNCFDEVWIAKHLNFMDNQELPHLNSE